MVVNDSLQEGQPLAIKGHAIEVVISEDGVSPMTLVMDPYDDIEEIRSFHNTHFSVKEWSLDLQAPIAARFRSERSMMLKKLEKHGASPLYFNRLANLASISGDFEDEESYLREALKLSDDQFFYNGIIESLVARQLGAKAEEMLAKADLQTNLYANLRLAAFYAMRSQIIQAVERVNAALEIDPLDFGARLFDGALKLWNGEYERSIVSFRVANEQRPNSAAPHTNLAVAYLKVGKKEKALQCLKMAVAINPLSQNSIALLADLADSLGKNEDSIPSLRFYVRYEQKNPDIWGRLARALLRINQPSEAIAALKRQASIDQSSRVWNNLGVAYLAKRDAPKALESFKHALTLGKTNRDFGYCIAATNFAGLSASVYPPQNILKFVDETVVSENFDRFASHRDLSGIFLAKLKALVDLHQISLAAEYGEYLLSHPTIVDELRVGAAVGLMALYSLNEGGSARALEIAKQFSAQGLSGKFARDDDRTNLLNNIAFVFAEHNDLEEATRHLQAISSSIHKLPYPTATSGLLHFKKGNLERADELYSEALRLSRNLSDKARIRQKWNLELGKAALTLEPKKALRYLTKAKEEQAEPGISALASRVIREISFKSLG